MPITATAEPSNVPPRVALNVFSMSGTTVTVTRDDPDGVTRIVRGAENVTLVGGAWTGYDYETPFGTAVTYSVVPDSVQNVQLLTTNQQTFETDTSGWITHGNSTLARTTSVFRSGVASLQVTAVAGGHAHAGTATTSSATPPSIPATAGVSYTTSAWVRSAATSRTTAAGFAFFDVNGALVGSYQWGTGVASSTGAWTQVTHSFTAPANTVRMAVGVRYSSAAAAEVHYVDDVSAYYSSDAAQQSSPVTLTVTDVWLIHPGIPSLSVRVPPDNVGSLEDRTRAARSAVHEPLGRATPLVVTDRRRTATTGMTVFTETTSERNAILALTYLGDAVLVNVPPALGWGVTYEWAALGDVTEAYWARGLSTSRVFTLPYSVVDAPVGGVAALWTYAGSMAVPGYTTYATLTAAYPTYADLLANSPS